MTPEVKARTTPPPGHGGGGTMGGRAAAARPETHGHGGGDVPSSHFGHELLRGSSTSRWVKALGQTGGIGALDRLGRRADTRLCALRRCTVRPLRSPVPSLCGTSPDDAGSPLRGTLDTEWTSGPTGPWINEAYLQPEASALPPARAWSRDACLGRGQQQFSHGLKDMQDMHRFKLQRCIRLPHN